MNHVLMNLLEKSTSYILERVRQDDTPHEKLNAFIIASLVYQRTHPAHNSALIEIVFNARTPDKIPYYKLSDDEEEPLLRELQHILQDGQAKGVFSAFNVDVMWLC
jgi:TetR/AcrR family transcriptional regulator, transcriptional repressor of bet genes